MSYEKRIRLVATDMDGTLLDSRKNLPPGFIEWVRNHKEIKTVIASGRQYYSLKKIFQPIADDLIFAAENGGLIFEKEEILYINEMLSQDVERCLKYIDGIPDTTPILCGAKAAYIRSTKSYVKDNADIYYGRLYVEEDLYSCIKKDRIVKIAVFAAKRAEEIIDQLPDMGDNLMAVLSGDSWIDISNNTVNKGTAIRAIQERMGISEEQSMAFGDYLNDYELLQNCGESYAMENAHPRLKQIAKYIADSNDHQGVMKVLHKLDEYEHR